MAKNQQPSGMVPTVRVEVGSGREAVPQQAIRRGLGLPAAEPATIVFGATSEPLGRMVERTITRHVDAIDLRGANPRLVVDNGIGFLQDLLESVPDDQRHDVRLVFAKPDITADQLVSAAIHAPDLQEYADRLERAKLSENPPAYEVRYQPVLTMTDRRVVGYESLLRATSGETVIDAEDLIARAARGHWTAELDHLGRTLAIRGLGRWLGEGLLFLNVMAPGGTFDEAAVHETIDLAEESGLDPDQIVLEAVERNRYTNLHAAAAQVESFRRRGVRIAVDDVGDGYAGLRVLSAFAPDIVKIAGHLVADLAPAETNRGGVSSLIPGANPRPESRRVRVARADAAAADAVVATLVEMAHRSGAWVVAENIETQAQFRRLVELGVDWGQGLFLGAPAYR